MPSKGFYGKTHVESKVHNDATLTKQTKAKMISRNIWYVFFHIVSTSNFEVSILVIIFYFYQKTLFGLFSSFSTDPQNKAFGLIDKVAF